MSITTTIKVNGVAIDPSLYAVAKSNLFYWGKDSVPYFRFAVRGGAFPPRPNPFVGGQPASKEITVYQNINGHGDILVFRGDCWDYDPHPSETGMIYEYMVLGLRDRADRVPVTDGTTNLQQMTFNYDPNDPLKIESRMGRSYGQMFLEVLEQPPTAAALRGYGIGNYSSAGSGAAFTANVLGGQVSSANLVSAGNNYTSLPTVRFIGGNPTTPAQATPIMTGNTVTGLNFSNHGSGYKSIPTIVISTLPAQTLADLDHPDLGHIPPHEVEFAGERVLTAVEGALKFNPNFFLYIQPNGTIRFLDSRKFGTTTVTINGDGTGARAAALVYEGKIIEIFPYNGGRNYTTATVSITDSAGGTGAAATATITSGQVTDIVVTNQGSGYGGALLTFTINQDIDFPSIKSSTRGCFQRVALQGANLIEPVILRLSDGSLEKAYAHSGLTVAQAEDNWKLSDWNDPSSNAGAATALAHLTPVPLQSITQTAAQKGSGYTTAPSVAINGDGSGATASVSLSGGQVTITLASPGTGYTFATLSVTGGNGTGAGGTVHITPTSVASIDVIESGYDYNGNIPRVVVQNGGGSGATATANLDGSGDFVSTISLGSGGSNYTSVPDVLVGGPNSPTNDYGTCTCPSTTTVRITSSDPTRSWAANVWDQTLTGKHAQILLSYSVGSGVTAKIRRKVIANTALTPGGTCDITVDQPLPIVAYDTYALRGTAGGAADVYRKYQAADPYYRTHMSNQPFSFPMAWHNTNSASVSQANTSTCSILYSATGQAPYAESPMGIDVDPDSGFIWTNKPVVVLNGTQSLLEEGGNNVDGIPNDIVMIIGVNMGILVSTCPADAGSPYLSPQFGGTSHTIEGLSTTKTVQVTDWRDPSNQANMDLLACALLDAFKDTRFEGSIPYDGLFVPSIFPGAKYNATSDEGATGFEAMNSPGMAFGVEWDEALIHRSQITVSNRKDPYSGQEFLAPAQTGAPIGLHDESIFSAFDKSKGMSFLSGFDQPTSPSSMGGTAPPPGPDEFMNEDMGGFV